MSSIAQDRIQSLKSTDNRSHLEENTKLSEAPFSLAPRYLNSGVTMWNTQTFTKLGFEEG